MARPDIVKLSETERQAFTDAYRFYERYHNMPNTVEAWETCYEDIKRISETYEDNRLVAALLLALYQTIELRFKKED